MINRLSENHQLVFLLGLVGLWSGDLPGNLSQVLCALRTEWRIPLILMGLWLINKIKSAPCHGFLKATSIWVDYIDKVLTFFLKSALLWRLINIFRSKWMVIFSWESIALMLHWLKNGIISLKMMLVSWLYFFSQSLQSRMTYFTNIPFDK